MPVPGDLPHHDLQRRTPNYLTQDGVEPQVSPAPRLDELLRRTAEMQHELVVRAEMLADLSQSSVASNAHSSEVIEEIAEVLQIIAELCEQQNETLGKLANMAHVHAVKHSQLGFDYAPQTSYLPRPEPPNPIGKLPPIRVAVSFSYANAELRDALERLGHMLQNPNSTAKRRAELRDLIDEGRNLQDVITVTPKQLRHLSRERRFARHCGHRQKELMIKSEIEVLLGKTVGLRKRLDVFMERYKGLGDSDGTSGTPDRRRSKDN